MPPPIAHAAALTLGMLGLPLAGALSATNLPRLIATIGPEHEISLTHGGRKVSTISRGTYSIVVRDRSRSTTFILRDQRIRLPLKSSGGKRSSSLEWSPGA